MEVRKHNARKITETFEYNTITKKDSSLIEKELNETGSSVMARSNLAGFNIAGERGKISLTFDERDKQQVVDLLRAMADSLDEVCTLESALKGYREALDQGGLVGFAKHHEEQTTKDKTSGN